MSRRIAVLMSTYNGEQYISEQIESIVNQKKVKVELYIRDDGSSDKTIEILKKYSRKYKNITWYKGKNLKSAQSFIELIKKMKKKKNNYYALSDQDDVWGENKLYNAIKRLEENKSKKSKLYISALNVVDENLKFKYRTRLPKKINFQKEMVKNYATGCTMVFDKNLKDILVDIKTPKKISMHDSYITRVAMIYDSYIYVDKNSYISYRQHSKNVLGMPTNSFKRWKQRWQNFTDSKCYSSSDAKVLLGISKLRIDEEKKNFLIVLSTYKKNTKQKLKLLFLHIFDKDESINNLLFRIKIIFNKV